MSPCLMCAEKNCHNCPCAICEVVNGKLQDNFVMQIAMKNKADCKKFMVRLSVELQQIGQMKSRSWTDKNNWRGFPAGWFKHDDLVSWLLCHC